MTLEDLYSGGGADIWGIDTDLSVSCGYDSEARSADAGPPSEWDDPDDNLPVSEKLRLAAKMIDRWKRYRIAVLERG